MKLKWVFLGLWLFVSGLVFLFVFQLNPVAMSKWGLGDALILSLMPTFIVFVVLFFVAVITGVASVIQKISGGID